MVSFILKMGILHICYPGVFHSTLSDVLNYGTFHLKNKNYGENFGFFKRPVCECFCLDTRCGLRGCFTAGDHHLPHALAGAWFLPSFSLILGTLERDKCKVLRGPVATATSTAAACFFVCYCRIDVWRYSTTKIGLTHRILMSSSSRKWCTEDYAPLSL